MIGIELADADHRGFVVLLVDGDQEIGSLTGLRFPSDLLGQELDRRCAGNLKKLARMIGVPLELFVTTGAWIDPKYRRRGYGAIMYLAAARVAASYRAAIVPHECAGGSTSNAAQRVWQGRAFADHTVRVGNVAVWRG